jgi:hypothetical protein
MGRMAGPDDGGLHLDTKSWDLVAGDPSGKGGDYFIGGAGEKGVRWSADDGGFTGSINKDGLKSDVGLGDAYKLDIGGDFKKKQLDFGLMSGDQRLADVYGGGKGFDDFKTGLKLPTIGADASFTKNKEGDSIGLGYDPGDGTSRSTSYNLDTHTATNQFRLNQPGMSYGFGQSQGPGGESESLDFKKNTDSGGWFSGALTAAKDWFGLSGSAEQKLGDAGSVNEKLGYNSKTDTTTLGMGANLKPAPGLSLSGSLDASLGPDHDSVSGKLGEAYRSKGFGETLSLGGSSDSKGGESFNASGSATAQILPHLYGSGFGSYSDASGKDPSAFAGGGLTYMPNDKLGLTAAGGYGSDGWEARLQADFFKGAVTGAGDLEDQRKKAAVSAYLGVSGGGGNHMNDVFGAGQVDKSFGGGGGPTFTAGIGIGF